jgi:hypothetical protein
MVTSMGRLTLNVLLSFAQFEREITGERIRDIICGCKKERHVDGRLCPFRAALRGASTHCQRDRSLHHSHNLSAICEKFPTRTSCVLAQYEGGPANTKRRHQLYKATSRKTDVSTVEERHARSRVGIQPLRPTLHTSQSARNDLGHLATTAFARP